MAPPRNRSLCIPVPRAGCRRRLLQALALLVLLPSVCAAQPRPAPARIAFLATASEKDLAPTANYFRTIMAGVGLAEGRDYAVEFFCSDGHNERFPALAQDAVARKPAVIIATTIASALAAQQATRTVPIVMTGVNDPVSAGLVTSHARPGGNVTGTSNLADDYLGKLVELTREALPGARRVAVLVNPLNPSNASMARALRDLATGAGLAFDTLEIGAPVQVDLALAELVRKRPDALILGFDNSHPNYRSRLAQTASQHRIALISADLRFRDADALVTYAPHRSWFAVPATYVQKILAGAKPADLPVQQPTRFELLVNTRVADALKLKLPQSLVLRATQLVD